MLGARQTAGEGRGLGQMLLAHREYSSSLASFLPFAAIFVLRLRQDNRIGCFLALCVVASPVSLIRAALGSVPSARR